MLGDSPCGGKPARFEPPSWQRPSIAPLRVLAPRLSDANLAHTTSSAPSFTDTLLGVMDMLDEPQLSVIPVGVHRNLCAGRNLYGDASLSWRVVEGDGHVRQS